MPYECAIMFKTLIGKEAVVFFAMRDTCKFCLPHTVNLIGIDEHRHQCNNLENVVHGNDNCKPHNCPLVKELTVDVP